MFKTKLKIKTNKYRYITNQPSTHMYYIDSVVDSTYSRICSTYSTYLHVGIEYFHIK